MRYTARFSNGTVATRTSEREYSHAYLVVRTYADGTKTRENKGFAREQRLAEKERNYYADERPGSTVTHAEVVPVEVRP